MHGEHTEHVIRGCEDHLGAVREHHRLQDVHHLGDVGHLEPLRKTGEDVEVDCGYHSVTHSVLLIQVSGIGALFHIEPGAPLVKHKRHSALGVEGVHDVDVILQDAFYGSGFGEGAIVFLRRKVRCRALAAVPALYGVVVQRKAVHLPAGILHHCAGPVHVVVGGTAGDFEEGVGAVVAGVEGVALVYV